MLCIWTTGAVQASFSFLSFGGAAPSNPRRCTVKLRRILHDAKSSFSALRSPQRTPTIHPTQPLYARISRERQRSNIGMERVAQNVGLSPLTPSLVNDIGLKDGSGSMGTKNFPGTPGSICTSLKRLPPMGCRLSHTALFVQNFEKHG